MATPVHITVRRFEIVIFTLDVCFGLAAVFYFWHRAWFTAILMVIFGFLMAVIGQALPHEAIQHFTNEHVCIRTLAPLRWAVGKPECPASGRTEHYHLAKQRRFKCKECWTQFTLKVGTLLQDSPIPLSKWLPALWEDRQRQERYQQLRIG
jgi:hypothetical protein